MNKGEEIFFMKHYRFDKFSATYIETEHTGKIRMMKRLTYDISFVL